jgi:hypothetical protein
MGLHETRQLGRAKVTRQDHASRREANTEQKARLTELHHRLQMSEASCTHEQRIPVEIGEDELNRIFRKLESNLIKI